MKQITVVTTDRPGVVAEISAALAAAGVNIEELTAEGVGGTAVAVLAVDRYDEALRALAGQGFKAVSEDALLVQLDDRSGELARITRRFKDANINLRSVRIIRRWGGKCFVALAAERSEEAMALVKDVLVS
jgi:hypothetical protein